MLRLLKMLVVLLAISTMFFFYGDTPALKAQSQAGPSVGDGASAAGELLHNRAFLSATGQVSTASTSYVALNSITFPIGGAASRCVEADWSTEYAIAGDPNTIPSAPGGSLNFRAVLLPENVVMNPNVGGTGPFVASNAFTAANGRFEHANINFWRCSVSPANDPHTVRIDWFVADAGNTGFVRMRTLTIEDRR